MPDAVLQAIGKVESFAQILIPAGAVAVFHSSQPGLLNGSLLIFKVSGGNFALVDNAIIIVVDEKVIFNPVGANRDFTHMPTQSQRDESAQFMACRQVFPVRFAHTNSPATARRR